MLPKQAIAFPEVAVIRKGTPKRKNPKNASQWIQGSDLNAKFRIAFAPGTDEVRKVFGELYPQSIKHYGPDYAEQDGFEMARMRCMLTTRNVADAWEWANEAYSTGRLIARADDNHFITLRDPLSGEYQVINGEPFTEFHNGMSVDYERDGKQYHLPIRTYGRLSLFLPELKRMVRFTLKTTSYYDRLNISSNLAAIQFLADTLNGGNAAGIPFYIYRREQEVTWNKPDGGAQRVKKWLVCIEADPLWVESTLKRMSQFALGVDLSTALLPAPITGVADPDDGEDEAPPEQEYGDEVITLTSAPAAAPASTQAPTPPLPADWQAAKAAKEAEKKGAGPAPQTPPPPQQTPARPYPPALFREKFQAAVKVAEAQNHLNVIGEREQRIVASTLDSIFNGEKTMRYEVSKWLTGASSTSQMSKAQIKALMIVLGVTDYNQPPLQTAIAEFRQAHTEALRESGQQELPGA